jgi:hypothetical protein
LALLLAPAKRSLLATEEQDKLYLKSDSEIALYIKLVTIEGGHLVPMTDPDRVAAEVLTL